MEHGEEAGDCDEPLSYGQDNLIEELALARVERVEKHNCKATVCCEVDCGQPLQSSFHLSDAFERVARKSKSDQAGHF
eukprot:CAMPEP_0170453244 /NCGR_PEP_ID=MMETSP0123-20130129/1882_1 /TAXON_ID=182087 /ORGANISM="Favella ehrenbergii, Strain Fehren 1" /LENGTH=77 /DNA_ID=CAMNT_0010715535 /DNA_START=824 /DNA_END=1057 /DNA_ORIENTATION=+